MTRTTQWEVVIGLETHVQLQTKSKIFSGSSIAFGAAPNVQASAVDIALPGVLPVLNREAVVCAIKFGLAVGAQIAPRSIFARKNYFYPDLPKGYQISQFEIPVVLGGGLAITVGAGDEPKGVQSKATEKFVHLTRAHLEEDAGKSLHEDFHGRTGIDLNRAGTPLLEIVTEPEMRSSAEAVAYAKALHALVQWIGICDGNMQEGSFRCDANVSVRPMGQKEFGTRREIKNLNSFRFMQQAIDFEVQWQINEIEEGRAIQQATVLFDPDTGETRSMRSKEDAHDYRYFPDPDLLPLEIRPEWIAEVKSGMPELPQAMQQRFQAEYGLSAYDAAILTASRAMADYYVAAVADAGPANGKAVANWIMGELSARLNKNDMAVEASPISAAQIAGLVLRIADNTISNNIAKKVFEALWNGEGNSADEIIEKQGLKQITDTGAIEALVDEVLAANQKSVEEFRAGKEKAFNALVGQAMKATKGKANPQQVTDLLKKKLG
ncbi:Asp-tRNA(Asn)/Glu-tRNA(Gln) amidotransferase subunit GatB [Sulfuritalea hydrogenivorans]|jgi:aspartyl-tRNA(Asn)/glutamyl-tRNA(Gln) amidotransferase subunit B|uniref:Aspartyl/glutamyl-tRNA(Asn/Gln) amidotransferase subunit B n=1 Tax=Sulfuritalea hydrogenivorans sk43H TaxID=1223802 RepID=W0SAX9_9PROT|nr:Asp-tRNA(Asn)/Glu-tRNA(Gln) amidotransferase subunit GatB [Sulfuritalea hydrogenivorans]BAO28047.1 aspartyl/glutamyl-tRNA amidotransferase subunit B [Sulfuritalea hydrogenivorans sk43H]